MAMRCVRLILVAAASSSLAAVAAAQELNPVQREALTRPPVQRDLLEPRPREALPTERYQAERYRSTIDQSIRDLERAQSSERDVHDRLRDLRSERDRIERQLRDANRP
jgi:hypothetical protein